VRQPADGRRSLFHIVVDTDDTAQRVLEVMNREKSGRITFMPLNRLRPKSYTYPAASNEAIPLIKRLKFNPIYRVAMEQARTRGRGGATRWRLPRADLLTNASVRVCGGIAGVWQVPGVPRPGGGVGVCQVAQLQLHHPRRSVG